MKKTLVLGISTAMAITMLAGCTHEKPVQTLYGVEPAEQTAEQNNKADVYIEGVHDISLPVGTDTNIMVTKLTFGVTSSGYVSVDYSTVDLNSIGEYTVTFTSDDGATAEALVIVTE